MEYNKIDKDILARALATASGDPQGVIAALSVRPYQEALDRSSNYQRNRLKITISVAISSEDRSYLQDVVYPHLEIDYIGSSYSTHGLAFARRLIEQELVFKKCIQTEKIVDVGGNWAMNIRLGRRNVHSCCPLIDGRDCKRDVERRLECRKWMDKIIVQKSVSVKPSEKLLKQFKLVKDFQQDATEFYCNEYAEHCSVKANTVVFNDSLYDITIQQLANILDRKKAVIAYGNITFSPEMLVTKSGYIRGMNCRWERRMITTTKTKFMGIPVSEEQEIIEFYFENDSSMSYTHDFLSLVRMATQQSFTTEEGRTYVIERIYSNGILNMTIVYAPHYSKETTLSFRYWRESVKGKRLVRIYDYDGLGGEIRSSDISMREVLVEEGFHDSVLSYALRLENDKFTPENIFNYACSKNARVTLNGVDISVRESAETEVVHKLSFTIWFEAFMLKFSRSSVQQYFINTELSARKFRDMHWSKVMALFISKRITPDAISKLIDVPNGCSAMITSMRNFLAESKIAENDLMMPGWEHPELSMRLEEVLAEHENTAMPMLYPAEGYQELVDYFAKEGNASTLKSILTGLAEALRNTSQEDKNFELLKNAYDVALRQLAKISEEDVFDFDEPWDEEEAMERKLDSHVPLQGGKIGGNSEIATETSLRPSDSASKREEKNDVADFNGYVKFLDEKAELVYLRKYIEGFSLVDNTGSFALCAVHALSEALRHIGVHVNHEKLHKRLIKSSGMSRVNWFNLNDIMADADLHGYSLILIQKKEDVFYVSHHGSCSSKRVVTLFNEDDHWMTVEKGGQFRLKIEESEDNDSEIMETSDTSTESAHESKEVQIVNSDDKIKKFFEKFLKNGVGRVKAPSEDGNCGAVALSLALGNTGSEVSVKQSTELLTRASNSVRRSWFELADFVIISMELKMNLYVLEIADDKCTVHYYDQDYEKGIYLLLENEHWEVIDFSRSELSFVMHYREETPIGTSERTQSDGGNHPDDTTPKRKIKVETVDGNDTQSDEDALDALGVDLEETTRIVPKGGAPQLKNDSAESPSDYDNESIADELFSEEESNTIEVSYEECDKRAAKSLEKLFECGVNFKKLHIFDLQSLLAPVVRIENVFDATSYILALQDDRDVGLYVLTHSKGEEWNLTYARPSYPGQDTVTIWQKGEAIGVLEKGDSKMMLVRAEDKVVSTKKGTSRISSGRKEIISTRTKKSMNTAQESLNALLNRADRVKKKLKSEVRIGTVLQEDVSNFVVKDVLEAAGFQKLPDAAICKSKEYKGGKKNKEVRENFNSVPSTDEVKKENSAAAKYAELSNSDAQTTKTDRMALLQSYIQYLKTSVENYTKHCKYVYDKRTAFGDKYFKNAFKRDKNVAAAHVLKARKPGLFELPKVYTEEKDKGLSIAYCPKLAGGCLKKLKMEGKQAFVEGNPDEILVFIGMLEFLDFITLNAVVNMTNIKTIEPKRKFRLIDGVPGCAKSTEIANSIQPGDMAAIASRAACEELQQKFLDRNKDPALARTIGSRILGRRETCERMFVDEGLKVHPGELILLAEIACCKEVIVFGDSKQNLFIPRVPGYNMPENPVHWTTEYRIESKTVPRDAVVFCGRLKVGATGPVCDGKGYYEKGFLTINPLERTMFLKEIHSEGQLPRYKDAKYVTFTQSDKEKLKRAGFSDTNTIDEFQGGRRKHVVLVRLQRTMDVNLRLSSSQAIVAVTRHTERLDYCTVEQPSTLEDLVYKGIKRVQAIDNLNAAYEAYTGDLTSKAEVKTTFDRSTIKGGRPQGLRNGAPLQSIISTLTELIPGSTVCDMKYDTSMIEFSDLKITAEGQLRIPVVNVATTLKPRYTLEPKITTTTSHPRQTTFRQCLLALIKRNLGGAYVGSPMDYESFASSSFENMLDIFAVEDWRSIAESWEPIVPDQQSLIAWEDVQNNSTKSFMEKVQIQFAKDQCDDHIDDYEFILKALPKAATDGKPMSVYPTTQTVMFHKKSVNCFFGPMVRKADERFRSILKPSVLYNKGKNLDDIENFLNENYDNSGYCETIENDFSDFDRGQKEVAHCLDEKLLKFLKLREEDVATWMRGHNVHTNYNYSLGLKVTLLYQRKSGDVTTAFGNTILNMTALAFGLRLRSEDLKCAMFLGDDSWMQVKKSESLKRKVLDCSERIAVHFNGEAKTATFKTGYFCGNYIIESTDGVKIAADPVKRAVKLGRWDVKTHEVLHENWISFADLMRNYDDEEIQEKLAKAVVERTTKATIGTVKLLVESLNSLRASYKEFYNIYSEEKTRTSY